MAVSAVNNSVVSAAAELASLLAECAIFLLDQDRVLLYGRALVIGVVPADLDVQVFDCSRYWVGF
jgi:hypothetical protein